MSRGGVDFEGVGVKYATFKLHAAITAAHIGKAVAIAANDTVGLGANTNPVFGKLIQVEGDGYGTVAYAGFVKLPYDAGAAPTRNSTPCVDGAGNVKNAAAPGRGIVTHVDAATLTAWVLL